MLSISFTASVLPRALACCNPYSKLIRSLSRVLMTWPTPTYA
jgi:hypothetical protein